jgi:hypothetical protein
MCRQATKERPIWSHEVNVFTYNAVGLPDLSADDYQQTGNPLGPALGALMKTSRLGKVAQKYQALRAMAASRVDEAREASAPLREPPRWSRRCIVVNSEGRPGLGAPHAPNANCERRTHHGPVVPAV